MKSAQVTIGGRLKSGQVIKTEPSQIRMAKKYFKYFKKKCSLSLEKFKFKQLRFHLTPVRMAPVNKTANTVETGEKEKLSFATGGNASWCGHSGNPCAKFSKN